MITIEAQKLAEQFLNSKGYVESKPNDAPRSIPNVLVIVPCHTGELKDKFVLSLLNMILFLKEKAINYELRIISGSSQITSVRNFAGNRVCFEKGENGLLFSHLLMIDSDSSGFEQIVEYLEVAAPIIALPYSYKNRLNWARIRRAIEAGVPDDQLQEYLCDPVLEPHGSSVALNALCPVKNIGTGTMLIKSEVFRALAQKHPGWRYTIPTQNYFGTPNRDYQFNFFQFDVDPVTNKYRSEDYFFVSHAREAGYETYLCPLRTEHIGSFNFVCNLQAIGQM